MSQVALSKERAPADIRAHYEIEKNLADQLRQASKPNRRALYSALYDELYQRVPHHPQLLQKSSAEATQDAIDQQMKYLAAWLNKTITFLEIGPGDCALALEVCKRVKQVYAVDVSDEITKAKKTPANFNLIISNGCTVPLPPNSVDLAYSNQLMEHLHPDDAFEQLGEIYQALAPGGHYICVTPNRLTGPHDVSREFDEYATGFHLKEYTITELSHLFKQVGFSAIKIYIPSSSKPLMLPLLPFIVGEKLLALFPFFVRKRIARTRVMTKFLNIRLIGKK